MNINSENSNLLARVVKVVRHNYIIKTSQDLLKAKVSGALHYKVKSRSEYPTIGDWVLFHKEGECGIIDSVRDRKNTISRGKVDRKDLDGQSTKQVIGANVDKVIIVLSVDSSRNITRGAIERYLTLVWDSGATPVLLINKIDCLEDLNEVKILVEEVSVGIEVYYISALNNIGLDEFMQSLGSGEVILFLGKSGVGKSTIINLLKGSDVMKTSEIRGSDKRGRHTTTHKEMVYLDSGAILIDCPGIKEIGLWADEESLDMTFSDIKALSGKCRFSDCSHNKEPNCAVIEALESGELKGSRFNDYIKMKKELRHLERKENLNASQQEKVKWSGIFTKKRYYNK